MTVTAMRRLIRRRSTLIDAPIAMALQSFSVITVDGEAEVARAFVRALICQLAVLHAPDQIVISAVISADTCEHWDWLKWLPHHQHSRAFDEVGSARLVYSSIGQVADAATPPDSADPRHVVMILDGGVTSDADRVDFDGTGVTVVEIGTALDTVDTTRRAAAFRHRRECHRQWAGRRRGDREARCVDAGPGVGVRTTTRAVPARIHFADASRVAGWV